MIVKQHAALIRSSTDVHHTCLYVSANYNSWKCDSSNQILEPELLYRVICGVDLMQMKNFVFDLIRSLAM